MSSVNPITLRGITWGHTRGLVPLQACAQRWNELNPEVNVVWEKRSLRGFEEQSIQDLAAHYDLLVIDHPWIGTAATESVFLPLDDLLPAEFLAEQAACSVGRSHESYVWANHLWALAIDAAAPVVAWRQDRLPTPPTTWDEVLTLAKAGEVEVPGAPINCLMNFYGLCCTLGEAPFLTKTQLVSNEIGERALDLLQQLFAELDPGTLERNPIQSLERLAAQPTDKSGPSYCLFPYGYSNYARAGYASHRLKFGDLPTLGKFGPIVTTLGGTGLAISARTKHRAASAAFAQFVADPRTQRTLYTQNGGQPGHRLAWLDEENNRAENNYFSATLPVLDRAFLRPRTPGHLHGFQEPAGLLIHAAIRGTASYKDTLIALNRLHHAAHSL